MIKRKKILSLLLAIVMMSLVFGGCKKSSAQTSSSGSEKPASSGEVSTVTSEGVETLSLEISIPNFGTEPQGTLVQEEWQKRMEEYLGVTLDITWNMTPWLDYRGNEKVLIQSGDVPDVSTYSQGSYVNEFGKDGLVLNITDYADQMKYYPEFVAGTNGGESYAYNEDGSAYYFMDGFVNPDNLTGAQSFTAYAYRLDILRQLGLDPATTKEEFDLLLEKLQAAIDGGDIDAKYVMSNSDKNYALYRGFVGIYHTWDTLYWNGTEWAFGPIEDNFRDMLKDLNGYYKAGYIDPEFATDDSDMCTEKAVNGNFVLSPTLWAGMARAWNTQSPNEEMDWGLSYLPTYEKYGAPWKWGSRQAGKSLANGMGIIVSAKTAHPDLVVKMLDYQYSDEMIELQNWGIDGTTFTVDGSGDHTFTDAILGADDPVKAAGDFGITSSSVCRSGIPFTPLTFEAMTEQIPNESWWTPDAGFYEGQYWIETGKLGKETISPADRPPVLRLSEEEATNNASFQSACSSFAKESALKFITGENDISDDAAWEAHISGVKSQVSDFDGMLAILQEKSDLESIG